MPPEKKPAPPPASDPFVEIVSVLFVLFFIMYVFNAIGSYVMSNRLLSLGWKAFTPQGIVLSNTRPINSLNNAIGVNVVSLNETEVYSAPGDVRIGSQKFNARGKILQGPVTVYDQRYWYVDYDKGIDGWVKEGDIAYLQRPLNIFERIYIIIFSFGHFLKYLSILLSVATVLFMGYLIRALTKLRMNERALLYPQATAEAPTEVNPKWKRILDHIESLNENDWRLAIIESDIMLDDLLDKLSLPGETIGDKLKAVEKSDFTTIENAWEAHKVRNQIAHEGSAFGLTQREARRVIELYRTVFEEFKMI